MISPGMLGDAGATVHTVNANPSGTFSRPSEPLEEHLTYIPSLIRKTGSRCAVVHDGDAALRRQVVRVESRSSMRGAWRFARPQAVGERRAAAVEGAYALAMALYACEQDAGVEAPWVGAW